MQEVFGKELRNIAGNGGSFFVSDTSAHTGGWRAFVVNTDAVISAMLDKDGNSLLSTLGLGSSPTISQGTLITVPTGQYITSITLTSGSIVLYGA